MEEILKVTGMHCKSCEVLLSDSIGEINGVANVKADSLQGTVKVDYANEGVLSEVKKVIEKEGYKVI